MNKPVKKFFTSSLSVVVCLTQVCFDYRENILKTAKALVEDTKTLVAGAASNQEQLAGAAQNAVMTITRLADCVKHGAASLGSEQPEAQVGGSYLWRRGVVVTLWSRSV